MLTVFTTDLSTNIMSNSLDHLVPRLDGTNYQEWSSAMQSYLLARGQWLVVVDSPVVLDEEGTNAAAVKEYNSENNKAMGNIRLRVALMGLLRLSARN